MQSHAPRPLPDVLLPPHLLHLCLSFVADWQAQCVLAAHKVMLDVIKDRTPSIFESSAIVREIMAGSIEADFELSEDQTATQIRRPVVEYLDNAVSATERGECPSLKIRGSLALLACCKDLLPTCIPEIHATIRVFTHLRQDSLTTAEHCYLWDQVHLDEFGDYDCFADWAELHFKQNLDFNELMSLRFHVRDMIMERMVKIGVARFVIL